MSRPQLLFSNSETLLFSKFEIWSHELMSRVPREVHEHDRCHDVSKPRCV
jgi:hypothetical protein